MSRRHVLKLRINDVEDNPIHPDGTLTVQVYCPGVTDWCRTYEVCESLDCDQDRLEQIEFDDGDDEPELHGVAHRCITGEYMVPTEGCFVQTSHNLWERAEEFMIDNNLGPGDYLVEHEFSDGELYEFTLDPEELKAGIR